MKNITITSGPNTMPATLCRRTLGATSVVLGDLSAVTGHLGLAATAATDAHIAIVPVARTHAWSPSLC